MTIKDIDLSGFHFIRRFTQTDAAPMLDMMHDGAVNQFFRFDGNSKTMEEITAFIEECNNSDSSLHLAIVTENNDYVGSISLKNIDFVNKTAEYAIISKAEYHGKGYALNASKEIFKLAFEVLGLHSVFLDVYSDNERAIAFYKKLGFSYEGESRECLFIRGEYRSLKWFRILEDDYRRLETV